MKRVDLVGKTALVTGASSGLGSATADYLRGAGAQVVMAVRRQESLAGLALAQPLQLEDAKSVVALADWVKNNLPPLDVLINNAGVMACALSYTADGHEKHMAVNYLGDFLLTLSILNGRPSDASPLRVATLGSRGHRLPRMHWDDPFYRSRSYDRFEAYGQSKTACILFAAALQRRAGIGRVQSYSVSPGMVATDLECHLGPGERMALSGAPSRYRLKTGAEGVGTTLWAATVDPIAVTPGQYLEDYQVSQPQKDWDARTGIAPWTLSEEEASRLFIWSEGLTGVSVSADATEIGTETRKTE